MDGIATPDADKADIVDKDRMMRERQAKLSIIAWKQIAGKWQRAHESLKRKMKGLRRYEELSRMRTLAAEGELKVYFF
jgi:hypothetical protein